MAKEVKVRLECQGRGYVSPRYLGRYPSCGQWNSMVEEAIQDIPNRRARASLTGKKTQPRWLPEAVPKKEPRVKTGLVELNRILGGGVVPDLLILVGGGPGVGKPTSLLQASQQLVAISGTVLYVSGEENTEQTKSQAKCLGTVNEIFYLHAETDMHEVSRAIEESRLDYAIIDSTQTMTQPNVTSAADSVSQARETTTELLKLAETDGIAISITGHVTKEESIAGPRMLGYMVGTVLYFEGDEYHTFRILRAVRNRLSPIDEIDIFETQMYGLAEVMDPPQVFLEEHLGGATESSIVVVMEGSRPTLVEIQVLITPAMFDNAKRATTRLDSSRVSLIMTVLEKRASLLLQDQDAYLKVVGGVKINGPTIDLALAISTASSYKEKGIPSSEYFIGETGLTGETRRVNSIEQRVHKTQKLGFTKVYVSKNNFGGWGAPERTEIVDASTVGEALGKVLK